MSRAPPPSSSFIHQIVTKLANQYVTNLSIKINQFFFLLFTGSLLVEAGKGNFFSSRLVPNFLPTLRCKPSKFYQVQSITTSKRTSKR